MEIWEPKPPGTLWATPGLLYLCLSNYHQNVRRAVFRVTDSVVKQVSNDVNSP